MIDALIKSNKIMKMQARSLHFVTLGREILSIFSTSFEILILEIINKNTPACNKNIQKCSPVLDLIFFEAHNIHKHISFNHVISLVYLNSYFYQFILFIQPVAEIFF